MITIDFVGRENAIHTVSLSSGNHRKNHALVDLFYENLDSLLQTLKKGLEGARVDDYQFNDFVVVSIENEHAKVSYNQDSLLNPDSYTIKLVDLVDALEKWRSFKSLDRNGLVETVVMEGEVDIG